MSELLTAALRYAGRGWPVFPLHTAADGRCSCGEQRCTSPAKHPRTRHGLRDATTRVETIRVWWLRLPSNIGIRTGAASGLVVLDVDGEDGAESLRALEREHGALPRTASVVTPRGGSHFYFRHPGVDVPNSAGKLGVGVDTRGENGYITAPPSIGANGCRYEPDERAPLAEMPGWLLERLRTPQNAFRRAPASDWIAIVRDGLNEGQRNDGLTRLVGHLLRRYVDVDLVAEIAHLVSSRCRPPLDAGEVDRIIDSVAGRELRRRRRREAA